MSTELKDKIHENIKKRNFTPNGVLQTVKNSINGINYDFKINNITKLFLNNEFIMEFIKKISNHPRCHFGLLSSMIQKNLKTANSGMSTMFNTIYPRHISLIDQRSHDGIDLDKKGVVPKFFRNLELILKHVKTKDKLYCFNKTNVLIIESKDFKVKGEEKPDSTKLNTLNVSVIDEELLRKPNAERKKIIKEKGEKLINYVYDLLENCPNDVRDYLVNHPFE